MARNCRLLIEALLSRDPLSEYRDPQQKTVGRHVNELLKVRKSP